MTTVATVEPQILPQAVGFTNTDLPDIVELRNIGQSYDGGKNWVVKGFNLLIEDIPNRGQFVVIMGTSGAGKSTVLRYISGLAQPTEGQVLINGKPRTDKDAISMVFQQYSSMPCYTVLENVALPLKYRGVPEKQRHEHAMEMIKLVGLEGHEHKYAKMADGRRSGLSGGQLQRVAIARSLIASPSIILMDEPFAALDTKTRLEMQLLVYGIWERIQPTIIFVTHDPSEAVFLADDIYLMRANPGQIEQAFPIDLPLERTPALKQHPYFVEKVAEVENALMNLPR